MFILKSKINKEIEKSYKKGWKHSDCDWKRKIDIALKEQKDIYELILQEKKLEIESLSSIIEQNKLQMAEASEKELNAKKLYLRAKEVISLVDFEFKKHLENSARSMVQFDKIRNDSELFTKQMLLNK